MPEKEEPKHAAAPARPKTYSEAEVKAPEPKKDDQGNVMVAPVTVQTSHVPHQDDPPAEDLEEQLDESPVPGGRFQVGDKIVNAEGQVLEDAPAAKKK